MITFNYQVFKKKCKIYKLLSPCIVNDCCNAKNPNVKFLIYGLPKNSERRESWLQIIGVTKEFLKMQKKKNFFICHLHFDDADFGKEGKRLIKIAVPHKNLIIIIIIRAFRSHDKS